VLRTDVVHSETCPNRWRGRRPAGQRILARTIAWPLALAFVTLLLADRGALADCTPASANNVTANCTGVTNNQGGGAPGTSAATDGYGTGAETGVTVNVGAGGTLSGDINGINVNDATVINNAGGTIISAGTGIVAQGGAINLTNSGIVNGTGVAGVQALTDVTALNNAGASIFGDQVAIQAANGSVDLINAGSVSSNYSAIVAGTDATVINRAGAGITGAVNGIAANGGVNLTNWGIVSGGSYGIFSFAGATIINNEGADISSPGIAVYTGDSSSIFNAGTISGGATAIHLGSNSTLTIAPTSVISGVVEGGPSAVLAFGGTGTANFDLSQMGPTAQYRDFGNLSKVGNSTWTLTGTTALAGTVEVNGGTLVVNGDLSTASILLVNPGGTLSGTGTVPFTLLDDGATLAPGPLGTGTGTLTIKDRVQFCDCSIYAVKVSGSGNDIARIVAGGFLTGDAFLDGQVRVSSPTSTYRFNAPYTILTTQGGLNGTIFASLVTPAGIAGLLSYTADDVLLTLTSQLGQITGLNINQRAVATALDTAFNAGASNGALGSIFRGDVPQNLTQASGEVATGSQQTTFNAMDLFMGVMTDPYVTGRGETTGGGATSFAPGDDARSARRNPSARDAFGMITKASRSEANFDQRWRVWAAGYGGSQSTGGDPILGSNAATSRVYGTAVGADYRISPFTRAGFAMAGGGSSFSVLNGGTGRSDLFQAGAFLRHGVGAAYITAALAYGWQDITTDRTVTIDGMERLRARFNANAWSGRLETGRRFVASGTGIGLTPYAAGQFTTFDLPAYAESVLAGAGTYALAYGARRATDTRSEVGLRTDKSFALPNAILTLRSRFAWAHDFAPDRTIAATFQSLPAATFVVGGAAQAPNSALTTAAAELNFLDGVSLAATFEGEFSEVSSSYAGKGVARYAW
jgi:autotransporter-associated beta strand protein